jgi:hypothetical protein
MTMFIIPNTVREADGFYISYNDLDSTIYGSDTTALVIGQMEAFYILNGDHRKAYQTRLLSGLATCLAYYQENLQHKNKHSDALPTLQVEHQFS